MPVNTDGPVGGGREEANQVKNQSGHRAVGWWQHVAGILDGVPDNHLDRGDKCVRQRIRKLEIWNRTRGEIYV